MPEQNLPAYEPIRRQTRTYDAASDTAEAMFEAFANFLPPAGTFVPTALTEQPEGIMGEIWKLANGQSLVKADYPRAYAIFGGQFGETATHFSLPNMAGVGFMGAPTPDDMLSFSGQREITLTVGQLPRHRPTVLDPGHGHKVMDKGHGHMFQGLPHGHKAGERDGDEHVHEFTSDPHEHDQTANPAAADNVADGADRRSAQFGSTSNETVTGTTDPPKLDADGNGLSIEVQPAIAGGIVAKAKSNIEIEREKTGIQIAPIGNGEAVNITPPTFYGNWMVRV
jgi:hypothetical protein